VKGSSELDNPKYANMVIKETGFFYSIHLITAIFFFKSLMFDIIDKAASKENEREKKKLEKKAVVAKIIEEQDAKKEQKAQEKKDKLVKWKRFLYEIISNINLC
jgi:hypothetical protein